MEQKKLELNDAQQELLNAFTSAIQLATGFLKRCPDTKARFRCEGKLEEAVYWMLHSSLTYIKPVELSPELLDKLRQDANDAVKSLEPKPDEVQNVADSLPQEAVA